MTVPSASSASADYFVATRSKKSQPLLSAPPAAVYENLSHAKDKVMQSLDQFREQASSHAQHYGQGATERMRGFNDWLQNVIRNTSSTLRVYVNRYPPLAAFLFTLLILSSVPLAMYAVFFLITIGLTLGIALLGFGIVEGIILAAGTGVLLAVLGGILLFTTTAFIFLSMAWLGYRGSCLVMGNLWHAITPYRGRAQKMADRASQSLQDQASQVTPPSR